MALGVDHVVSFYFWSLKMSTSWALSFMGRGGEVENWWEAWEGSID